MSGLNFEKSYDAQLANIASQAGHTHANKSVLDALSDSVGVLQYNGKSIEGGSSSTSFETIANIKDFGSPMDGIADDAPGIRAASIFLHTMCPKGGTVFIPAGTAIVNSLAPTVPEDSEGPWTVIRLYSNITYRGEGQQSIIKAGDGLVSKTVHYVFGRSYWGAEYIYNCRFENFTIDLNSANNQITPAIVAMPNEAFRYSAIGVCGENIVVDNMHFEDCPGYNVVDVTSHPLSAGGHLPINARITNCRFHNFGAACAGSEAMYDCSAIFVLADVVWVLNNEFVNDNADLDYDLINANAMEIHTKEAYIKNNIVKNCRFSFIVCSDANVNIEYAQFKDNYVENCDTVIYAENSAGNYIDTVEMINIHGTLRHTNETRAFFDFAVSVPLKKLIVRHCDVKNTYDSAVAATASSETSGFVKSVNSDMIEICDNTFDGCYGAGIYIIPMNSSNMEVNISRNNLKNCVMSSNVLGKPNYGAFIGFEDASDMKSVIIDGNITEKNDSNSKVTHLAYLSGTYSNVNISDNKVIGYTGKIRVGGVLGDSIIHHACSVPPTFIGDNKAPCSIGSTWYDSSAGLHYTKTANNNAVDGWDVDTVSDVKTMLVLTQAAYTALATKDPNTLYLING